MVRVFNIAIPNDGAEETELNRFLVSHRIVSVRTQWVARRSGDDETPYQVFTVEYAGGTGVPPVRDGYAAPSDQVSANRPDYRKLLTQEQFVRYCKMRDERKKIADGEAVKAFVVFTNEQLAAIARLEKPTLAALKDINGIGDARVEKYGARIIAAMDAEMPDDPPDVKDARSADEEVSAT